MEFSSNVNGGVTVISLDGDLDEKSAAATRAYLDEKIRDHCKRMILDFKKVTFMDSTGIGVLLGRYKKLTENGTELCVTNLNAQTDKVFRISGLYQIIKAVQL
ncbi:MAG TPA: anti-sigma F factor antagonist [Clostridiales bacterium]|nr:anti-sigma F factor antagonist [Clostridiales bacterium]